MADKELRSMNRTELIEIIYALQQEERALRAENEKIRRQMEDKTLRMEKARTIAEEMHEDFIDWYYQVWHLCDHPQEAERITSFRCEK